MAAPCATAVWGEISSYGGLFSYAPGLATLMTVFLFSLAGVPPLAGWVAKFTMFRALIDAGGFWAIALAVLAGLNSVVALFYYANVSRQMWMSPVPDDDRTPVRVPASLGFALLLTGLPDASVLLQVAQRVLACLRDPFVVGEREVFIRCSVGAAAAARGAPPDATLLTQADLARREANAAGGNAARLYDAARLQHGFDRLQIEHDLHHALARRELNVFYQPQVDARTRELVGFEALMRWQRAGTMQPAARFIEIAEDTGLIVPMGEWAIGEACAALAAMRAVGLSRCLMSINLSCQQLRNARLPGVVTDAAGRHGLTCADIEVELTESGIMRDADNALQALAQLRSHGAGVAVDDFGTGYSSLSYLTRLPLTTLKIDRSFVRDVHRSRQSREVARAIASMGGHLGLRVIAEGVETDAQCAALIELGCPLQQGYLHGHAVALDEALRWAEPSAGGNR